MDTLTASRRRETAGPMAATVMTLSILIVTLRISGFTYADIVLPIMTLIAIRSLHFFLGHTTTLQLTALPASSNIETLRAEAEIAVTFLAATYLFNWPVRIPTMLAFLLVNASVIIGVGELASLTSRSMKKKPRRKSNFQLKQLVVVGSGQAAQRLIDSLQKTPEMGVTIKGILDYHRTGLWRYRDVPLLGHPEDLAVITVGQHVDALVMAVEPDELPRTESLFMTAERMGIPVCVVTELYRPRMSSVTPTWLNGTPALYYYGAARNRWSQLAKTTVDKLGALIGIVLTFPLMALAAVTIKAGSRGSVLFRQTRCGINGRQFTFYKFRTMCHDAEQKKDSLKHLNLMSGPVFKAKNDPRVTRIGKLLRRWSIDELPQLFNVLRGDMSLVGPRPPLPTEIVNYEPWQRRRLAVKPGVTCLWQVYGRNAIDFETWMQLDLEYIDNWSLWMDTRILARTIPAVLKGTGAH